MINRCRVCVQALVFCLITWFVPIDCRIFTTPPPLIPQSNYDTRVYTSLRTNTSPSTRQVLRKYLPDSLYLYSSDPTSLPPPVSDHDPGTTLKDEDTHTSSLLSTFVRGWVRNVQVFVARAPYLGDVCESNRRETLPGRGTTPLGASSEAKLRKQTRRRKKKVLILMSDTGGGHRASAQALESALTQLYPNQLDTTIVDIWTQYSRSPFDGLVDIYRYLGQRPRLWLLFYECGRFPITRKLTELYARYRNYAGFKKCIDMYNPDLILSLHPLCQDIPLRIIGKRKNHQSWFGRSPPTAINNANISSNVERSTRRNSNEKCVPKFATVVTDLGSAHPTWFDTRSDAIYVPTEELAEVAVQKGLLSEKVRNYGLPLRRAFWEGKLREKAYHRSKLGLLHTNTVLLVGGGDGVGRLEDIAVHTAERLSNDIHKKTQIVVVCGKNQEVREQISSHVWPKNVNVVVLGFVPNLHLYMAAADLIITKAGPGTIAEACTLGLPIVLSSYLPGQEKGNVAFVTKGEFGVYQHKPRRIAKTVSSLLQHPDVLEEMGTRAQQLGRPTATMQIAEDIGKNLLFF